MKLSRLGKTVLCASILIATFSLAACGGGSPAPAAATPVTPAASGPVLAPNPINLRAGITLGSATWAEGPTATGGTGAAVGGVTCLVTEDYHVHAHLSIIQDGQSLAVPANIGLRGCAYELHTHDNSGIIHVETAAYHRLTLGQFFAVWGQPLSASNVAGISGLPLTVFINDGGVLTQYQGDVAEIELIKHREITLVLGAAVKLIPSFAWDPAL